MQLRIIIFKNRLFQTCIIVKRTCTSIFSKIGLVDQSKPCTQIYLQIIANCINLQLAIRISKNHAFRTCTTPSRTFRQILSSIGLLDNELPRKEIISTDGRTDGQTDRQTDGRTDRRRARQQLVSFFKKRKKTTKNAVFRVITELTENLVGVRTIVDTLLPEQLSAHFGVCCVVTRSILKPTDAITIQFNSCFYFRQKSILYRLYKL